MDTHVRSPKAARDPLDCLAGGGEMGALLRKIDWSQTALGPVERWSQALRTTVGLLLRNRFPMLLWWGPRFVQIYNDAYRPIPGDKHPRSLGQSASECWAEIWHIIAPMIEAPFRGEPATWSDDLELYIDRRGFPEETHFKVAYSPVPDESVPGSGVGGVLATVSETTAEVYGARQLRTLRELGARAVEARTPHEACATAAATLAQAVRDVPFALLYLVDEAGGAARLAGSHGLDGCDPPETLALDGTDDAWPIERVVGRRQIAIVDSIARLFPRLPPTERGVAPHTAIALPLASPEQPRVYGFLVAGVSPHRTLDAGYRTFFELAAAQIVTAIRNARAYHDERRRADALAEIERHKTRFFSNVSHELRTPLTLMLGPTEDALAAPERCLRGDDLETVHRNELRLLKLVNQLLDFSRSEAGRAAIQLAATDLAQLTADVASAFRSAIEKGGLAFAVDCPPLAAPILVDREMWEKIVLNLVSNAFKHTFAGSVRVAVEEDAREVRLTVADTGVGIPEAELPRLFDRFHRVEGTRSRSHEGSGIGLALVHDLVRLHGGRVDVTSAVGRGSTFTVTIPRATRATAATVDERPPAERHTTRHDAFVAEALRWLPDAPSAPALALGVAANAHEPRARILVADDNADMRAYVTRLLGAHWRVEAVADGEAALAAALREPPDLVLSDVMMPGLDGFTLLRALRDDPRTAGTQVILLSARAGEEAIAEGLRAGADDYLVKPFAASALLVRVEARLAATRARAALAAERRDLFELFLDGPAAICVLRGPRLVIEVVNRRLLEVWAKTDAIVGLPLVEALPEIGEQPFPALLERVMATGEPYRASAALARLDRSGDGRLEDVWFDFVYQPIREGRERGREQITGVLVFAVDVTEQVLARRAAERALGEAETANRAKDEFLAILGHELRNPLAPIVTALHLMQLRAPETCARERTIIARQADHLIRLVDDLMDVSRITRGKVELKRERLELSQVVATAIEMASPLVEERQHALSVSVPPHGLPVEVDPSRMAQVLGNLLTNAAKYTEKRGAISVTGGRSGDGRVVLSVRDNGIGIAPAMLPRVFDMFVQERQSLDRSLGGLGLGLTIVRSLVQLHGGTVDVASDGLGRGSEFIVTLPCASDARSPEPTVDEREAAPRTGEARRGRLVLVVDDNEDTALLLASSLEAMGHTTRVAHDGPSALRLVADVIPDVVLLDIGLPLMDGYELARRLRARPGWQRVLLAAVTGYGQEIDRRRSGDAGIDEHLVKPVDLDRLRWLIERQRREDRFSDGTEASGAF